MRFLRAECIGGASGDMVLGALVDLGIDPARLRAALAGLNIGPFELTAEKTKQDDLSGTRVTVTAPGDGHTHRHLADIRAIIEGSDLPRPVKELSLATFTRLAEAEARVHGTAPDRIHFHEVGAVDSIVDIVGSCLGFHLLQLDGVATGAFPAGHGTIQCEHGVIPSPAPATLELLKGRPVVQTDEPYELVTPTGAALLTTWPAAPTAFSGARIEAVGYGFGHRKLDHRPNVLRFTLLVEDAAAADLCTVLECNVDDTSPELLGALAQKLMEGGALDAFVTPVQMKKQRPGSLLSVLCMPTQRETLLDLIFRETTTFGVREHEVARTRLDRRFADVETPHGRVRVKIGTWRGKDITWAPEMDDCMRLAREKNLPVRAIYEAALAAIPRRRE